MRGHSGFASIQPYTPPVGCLMLPTHPSKVSKSSPPDSPRDGRLLKRAFPFGSRFAGALKHPPWG